MIHLRSIVTVMTVALAVSLALNFFYVYTQLQEKKGINNMMLRALGSYGAQIDTSEYFLTQYLVTKNMSLVENEASWCAYGAELAVDVCRQGSDEEMYSQLWNTAVAVQSFAHYYVGEGHPINETKLTTAIHALDHIWRFFFGFGIAKDQNPLEYLVKVNGTNATATVIYYCQIAQENLPRP